jgi:hypothetical protein
MKVVVQNIRADRQQQGSAEDALPLPVNSDNKGPKQAPESSTVEPSAPHNDLDSRKVPSKDHWRKEAFKDLHAELSEGRVTPQSIPPTFLEEQRIVDPCSLQGVSFQHGMEALTKRLLPDLDLSKHPITFVMGDTQEKNGYIVTTPRQSLICFELELLKSFDNLDQLSWVLLHELTHLEFRGVFDHIPVSQTEELLCDLRPLWAMFDARLNPTESEAFAVKMAETKQPPWMSLVDAHGLPPFRVAAIQLGLVALRECRGALKDGSEPLPDDLNPLRLLKGARHESHLTRVLEKQDYSSRSTLDKLEILQSYLSELEPRFASRTHEFGRALQQISISKDDKEERGILIAMMDSLIDNPSAFNMLNGRIRELLDGKNPDKIRYHAPRLIELAQAAKAFIQSEDKTKAEKEKTARTFVETLEALPAWQSLALSSMQLPSFELEKRRVYQRAIKNFKETGDEVLFPWEKIAEAAGPENQIARALLCLGTWDDRIPYRAGPRDLEWIIKHLKVAFYKDSASFYTAAISKPNSVDNDVQRSELKTDGNGHIVAFDKFQEAQYGDSFAWRFIRESQDALDHHKLSSHPAPTVTNTSAQTGHNILSFTGLPYHEFIRDPYTHLRMNQTRLCPLSESLPTLTNDKTEARHRVAQRVAAQTSESARELLRYFDGMLSIDTGSGQNAYRDFVRAFFLDRSTEFNFETIRSSEIDLDAGATTMKSYLEWLLTDKHSLFTLPEKGSLFGGYLLMPAKFYRRIIGIAKPENMDDLLRAIDLYLKMGASGLASGKHASIMALTAISEEVEDFLRDHAESNELWRLLAIHGEVLSQEHARSNYFDEHVLKYLKRETTWPSDALMLGSIYRAADALGLIPNEQWRRDFTGRIITSIDQSDDFSIRIAALENLLLGSPLKDVDLREGVARRWVKAIAEHFGPDDTRSWNASDCPYLEKLQPVLDRISKGGHSSIRESLLRSLGDEIVAQRQVSHALEKAILGPIDENGVLQLGLAYGGLQTSLAILGSTEEGRLHTIRFLIRPLTSKSLKDFAREVGREAFDTVHLFGSGTTVDEETPRYRERLRLECKRVYDNFWRVPKTFRATLLQDLLMPAQNRLDDLKAGARTSLEKACDLVISELLPLEDAKGQPNKYASEAQRLLRAFLAPGVLDHRQQPILLAALMSASQASNDAAHRTSVGQRLAVIFDSMGPAWKKFGQAVSSHPSTPPDIARDMEPLKGKRSVSRPEAWALYEGAVPEEIRLQNPRLGPVLESASFFTAIDAGDDVFTLLTPNALPRANDGFSIMESFVAELRKADDEFSQIAQPVSEMVRSARISAVLETNGRVGAAQAEAMHKTYHGIVVNLAGQQFPVSTAIWRDHGPEFRRMQKMKGPTFNDLPSQTPEEALHKRKVAKAILYVELRNILSGGAFCVDRHGRNIRVDGNSIGHFDHGAVHAVVRDRNGSEVNPLFADKALEDGGSVEICTATKAELLQLADALYASYEQLSKGRPLAVVMHEEIEKARAQTGNTPDYLIRVERALLALNDCFKCLDSEGQDIKDLLGSLYLNGHINPLICETIEKKIGQDKLGILGKFVSIASRVRGQLEELIKERVTTSQNAFSSPLMSRWHDHGKNRKDYPSLLTTKDFAPKRSS